MSAETVQSPDNLPRDPSLASPTRSPHLSSTGPLLVWLSLQLGAILLAVCRVPLSARYPVPAEQMAPYLLLATQLVGAALLFPFLLRDLRVTLQVLATALPFQMAATYLAGLNAKDLVLPMAFTELWIIAFSAWSACLQSMRSRMIGVAIASCLTLGGGIFRYLRAEFSASPPASTSLKAALPLASTPFESTLPLPATFDALVGLSIGLAWIVVFLVLFSATSLIAVRRLRRSSAADLAPKS